MEAIVLGLNHIPLINTNTQETIQVVVDTFMHKYVKYWGINDVWISITQPRWYAQDARKSSLQLSKVICLGSGTLNPPYYVISMSIMNHHGY